jgi:hypothetical protein
MLTSGNISGSVSVSWVNAASAALKREFPDNPVMLLSSGLDNMNRIADKITGPVDIVLYDYEPNFDNEPEFSWDFAVTTDLFAAVSSVLRPAGFQAGGYPTGRPVLQLTQSILGWVEYGWHYGELRQSMDWLVVQTQTYCKSGVSRYADALDRVDRDMAEIGHKGNWYPQVTFAAPETNVNSVTVQKALQCTEEAVSRGLPGIVAWWSPQYVDDMVKYLKGIGR